jgi:preprotein translocase subunit SecA
MAGRGTDIILGGKPAFEITDPETVEPAGSGASDAGTSQEPTDAGKAENSKVSDEKKRRVLEKWKQVHEDVVELGGLHIVGTERHEARRIDNQLRGRAGRQGDPGSSRFYLSLEDDLLRIFGSENITNLMQRLGMEEGVPIESKLITRQIERAQGQVEARNFEIRKHLLEYDDVMNKQREEIYRFRRDLLEGEDQKSYVFEMGEELILDFLDSYANTDVSPAEWDYANLKVNVKRIFGLEIPEQVVLPNGEDGSSSESGSRGPIPFVELSRPELEEYLISATRQRYEEKEQESSPEFMRWFERMLMLQIIDQQWKDHLLVLDHLKEGIGLRGYGQRDPKVEYKRESFALFEDLRDRVREEVVKMLFLLRPASEGEEREVLGAKARRAQQDIRLSGGELASGVSAAGVQAPQASRRPERGGGAGPAKTVIRATPKVGRNDPCPCGSGKKFKKCCGR